LESVPDAERVGARGRQEDLHLSRGSVLGPTGDEGELGLRAVEVEDGGEVAPVGESPEHERDPLAGRPSNRKVSVSPTPSESSTMSPQARGLTLHWEAMGDSRSRPSR